MLKSCSISIEKNILYNLIGILFSGDITHNKYSEICIVENLKI